MKPERIYTHDLFLLGEWVEYLGDRAVENATWRPIRESLEQLCKIGKSLDLQFIVRRTEAQLAKLSEKNYDDHKVIEHQDRIELEAMVGRFEGKLEELLEKWVISIPQAHVNISKLANGIKSFLHEEELSVLEPIEQKGLDEAASCLLHNNFTSSEFIALRTVESILRRWYKKKTGKTIRKGTFGSVLNKLDKEFPEPNRPEEISSLYHLKRRRNAVAHPHIISNEEDATVTFLDVIRMCKDVKDYLVPDTEP